MRVAQAAAPAEAQGPAAGLALLDAIDRAQAEAYQPYRAVRARLLARRGARVAPRAAYARAIALAEDPAVRDWLAARGCADGVIPVTRRHAPRPSLRSDDGGR